METINTVRIITDHIADKESDTLEITALDAPGAGGASNHYEITGMDFTKNPALFGAEYPADCDCITILFQNGTIPEAGVNGLTMEALLAIVADRLRGFQTGPYACQENELALLSIEEALDSLKERTRKRIKRGVEGKREA